MSSTRRQFLLASTGGLAALAGCSGLSDPQQSLLIAVNNYSSSRHQGYLSVEKDGTELVRQYLEVGAANPDEWTTVETEVALGEMPGGTSLNVTASFGDDLEANGPITLDCYNEYTGDVIYVQIEKSLDLRLNEACYDEFPSGEARQGGIDRS
ncbi:hypothetical protein GJ633_03520 [Halorubrum sp. CBA1125]|uniref:hypothetical protein n=1 Tax=Halorubrum sp. CBA1125 TaxID=2668072 RepID=UPI0012E8AD2E|nr:hypothetical protein [Halorubrum sp. CBA1125]MUW13836.1 hypothetical protein [Halorubrum sp. CBA1125]